MNDPGNILSAGADPKLAYDLVLKAYEHHKTHARFEETQRSWMLTAYLTLTGLVFVGIFSHFPQEVTEKLPVEFIHIWVLGLILHLVVGICLMISVSKVSGEFRRHFSKAENIVKDVSAFYEQNQEIGPLLNNLWLETAAIRQSGSKRKGIVPLTNAAVHAYLFSAITATDVNLLTVGILKLPIFSLWPVLCSVVWFVFASFAQHRYIKHIESIGA